MSRKSEKIIRYLNTGIFEATVLFSVGYTYDEIIAHLKESKAQMWEVGLSRDKDYIDKNDNCAISRSLERGSTKVVLFYIILKREFDFSDHDYCKLAHECLHICQFMLPDILDMSRELESVAYTHTHLMRQCLEELRGKKTEKKSLNQVVF